MKNKVVILVILIVGLLGCKQEKKEINSEELTRKDSLEIMLNNYVEVSLTADLDSLSEIEQQLIPLFFDIAKIIDEFFWYEAFGSRDSVCSNFSELENRLFMVNYGPWDRLNGNKQFIDCIGEKARGANFYPSDMSRKEFDAWDDVNKKSAYTFIRRTDAGKLEAIPYHVAFTELIDRVVFLLQKAAEITENENLERYLLLRSKALQNDDYFESDLAWMDLKNSRLDFVFGPIEHFEDQLFGYKAEHQAFVLIRDKQWSKKLEKYTLMLKYLQKALPVPDIYKKEEPGDGSEIVVYDLIYSSGSANAGGATIALNLPNDARVQIEKGSRRAQFKNVFKAKFDHILLPISTILIAPEQQEKITFDAFFENGMFHEMAQGLGIRNTINESGTVRDNLKELFAPIELIKAEVLSLYLDYQLYSVGEIDAELTHNYTTFLASIFRKLRFGSSSNYAKANLVCFNFFLEQEAFSFDGEYYSVNFDKMKSAIDLLSRKVITIQGDGNYEKAQQLLLKYGTIDKNLQESLDKLEKNNTPIDVVFNQGLEYLGIY